MKTKKVILGVLLLFAAGISGAVSPKVSYRLGDLSGKEKRMNRGRLKKYAKQNGVEVTDDGMVTIVVRIRKNASLSPSAISAYGGEYVKKHRNLVKIRIPVNRLEDFAESSGDIEFVRLPLKPYPVETSEGVALTGASTFHGEGYTGSGSRIAIIDVGYIGYQAAISNGDLPAGVSTYNYSSGGFAEDSYHGTAVAEIVHDMAPGAELYLMKISDDVDLGQAKDTCKSLGVDVANHSIVWFNSGPGDGTGSICDIANDAYDNNILWVNSAGNFGQMHWQGSFYDPDGDGRLNFSGSDEGNTVQVSTQVSPYVDITLRWNDTWNNSSEDYHLWLMNDSGQIVAKSEFNQNGSAGSHPTEQISYIAAASGEYHVMVVTNSVTGIYELELFSLYQDFEHKVSTGSICEPADSPKVLAVGAVYHGSWANGPQESFSSLGPSNGGLVKPDVTGPDGTQCLTWSTYRGGGFYGTSAAAPHVAGAAGLILSRNTSMNALQLFQKLENDAVDIGDAGKDNIYGSGKLRVLLVPPEAPDNLLTEGRENPVGLTVLNPRFSWTNNDPDPGDSQSACQILVSSDQVKIDAGSGETWDSGKQVSVSSNTVYGGGALARGTTYFWKVRIWDAFNSVGPYSYHASFQLKDSSAPADIEDLSSSTGPVDGSVLLTWTAPGDDGTSGCFAGHFYVQHATFAAASWAQSSAQVSVSSIAVTPDTIRNTVVGGLIPRLTYYLVMWTEDESGNLSAVSNVTSAIANSIPSAPEDVFGVGISTGGLKWTWTDTYDYEDGFYVMDASGSILDDLPVNSTYWVEVSTDHRANTSYGRIIACYAPGGVIKSGVSHAYTLSNPPSGLHPTVQGPHTITMTWIPGAGGNTRFAVDMSEDSLLWCSSNTKTWTENIYSSTYTYGPPLYHKSTYYFRVWGYNGDAIITSTHTNTVNDVTRPVSYTIYSPPASGEETTPDGRTKVVVPSGSFSEEGYIVINENPLNNPSEVTLEQIETADSKINTRRKVYHSAREFTVYNLWGLRSTVPFTAPVTVTVPYLDDDSNGIIDQTNILMPGMAEDSAEIHVLNESNSTWELVSGQALNLAQDHVTADVMHFSLYILLGEAPATDLDSVKLFPNPCSTSDSGVTFTGITQEASIRIFNMAGELVATVENEAATSTLMWDLTNSNGSTVSPGIYVYMVTDWMMNSSRAVGKIAVIP